MVSFISQKKLYKVDGYYLLRPLPELVDRRLKGNELAVEKLKLALRIGELIGSFPFVTGVMLSGSISKGYMEVSVENVAGIWNLSELMGQLASCKLFITNDSGPMHLAAFLGVPTVASWGPTHYRYFGYENLSHVHNVSLDLECSPCFKDPTSEAGIYCQKRIDCMQNLSPSLIVKQVEHLLIKTENERRVALPAGMANNQLENVSDNLKFQIS